MPKHFNLYYLLLEDAKRRSIPESKSKEIRKNILLLYKKIKPLLVENPLIGTGSIAPVEKDETEKSGGM